MAQINQSCHTEQPEHQTVLIHDARNIIQRIDSEKQHGESESALLDCAELFGHWRLPAGTIRQLSLGCKSFVRFEPMETALKRARRLLLPVVLVAASILVVGAKKIFDYAAAPDKEKESDFVFPRNPDQEKPTVFLAEPKSPPFPFDRRGGSVNDPSPLHKTDVYAA